MSAPKALTHGVGNWRPVGAPSVVNSTSRNGVVTSLSHRLDVNPTPQANPTPVGGNDLITSPAASGAIPLARIPGANSARVFVAFGLRVGFFARRAVDTVDWRAPPDSLIVNDRLVEPEFASVSWRVRVWLTGTVN